MQPRGMTKEGAGVPRSQRRRQVGCGGDRRWPRWGAQMGAHSGGRGGREVLLRNSLEELGCHREEKCRGLLDKGFHGFFKIFSKVGSLEHI